MNEGSFTISYIPAPCHDEGVAPILCVSKLSEIKCPNCGSTNVALRIYWAKENPPIDYLNHIEIVNRSDEDRWICNVCGCEFEG